MAEKITEQMVVRNVVVKHPGLRLVMEKLGVDYCCGGQHTLKEAAAEKGVDLKKVIDGLNAALAEPAARQTKHKDWSAVPLTELMDHIVSHHHTFMKEQMPRLETLLDKALLAHEAKHGTELRTLEATFRPFKAEIDQHLLKEEQALFPTIRQPEPGAKDAEAGGPINLMRAEHESAGRALARMREVTSNYQLPADACPTFAALYDGLTAVEADLHEHIHLENNILFLKVLALAKGTCDVCQGFNNQDTGNKTMTPDMKTKPAKDIAERATSTAALVDYQPGSVVSREIISKKTGMVTLFAFDADEGLSEHTSPYDALVNVLEGEVDITIAGKVHRVKAGELILMPAGKPHKLQAVGRFKMMLTMIRS